MKRILAILLVLCTLFLLLVGCKKKNGNDATEAPTDTESESTEVTGTDEYGQDLFNSTVPIDDLDFEGKEVVILCRDSDLRSREFMKDSYDTSDELDNAISERNDKVNNDLNMTLRLVKESTANYDVFVDNITTLVKNDVENELHEYDILADHSYPAMRTVLRDYKANLYDTDIFPYFDFSKPCWNQTIVNETAMNNKLYAFAGDVNLSLFDSSNVIWHNKSLYEEKKSPSDPEDMQQLALDGDWTYGVLYDWARKCYEDSNFDNDCGDTYGFLDDCYMGFVLPQAWYLTLVTTNNDGTHSYNVKGNAKAEIALTNIRYLLQAEGTFGSKYFGKESENICYCEKQSKTAHFAAGTIVFMCSNIFANAESNKMIREMEDKYALLPIPKFDDDQKDYATSSSGFNLMSVVNHHYDGEKPIDGELISAYLQYSNEQSYTNVRGYYFKRIIEPKFFGTDDSDGTVTKSIELFNNIIDNVRFDFWVIYSPALNDIGWLWRDNIERGKGNTLEASFKENAFSGPGTPRRTEAQYNEILAEFDRWILF